MGITSKQIKQAELMDRSYSLNNDWEITDGKLSKVTPDGALIVIYKSGKVKFTNLH